MSALLDAYLDLIAKTSVYTTAAKALSDAGLSAENALVKVPFVSVRQAEYDSALADLETALTTFKGL